ncbi:minor tail protein L [Stenotrophomonas phage BUCTxx99]|nr:minor tail protein L [Stenotrophomonas phage BUCTxx99]
MSGYLAEIQKQNPEAIVELYELDGNAIGMNSMYFHADLTAGPIIWQGIQYDPWPLEGRDFARTSEQQPTPKLIVANIDGRITQLCMQLDDMVGTVVKRVRTFVKFLDAVNFPDGNPDADPNEFMPPEVWYIERKAAENREQVSFELVSAFDLDGVRLPRRQVIANYCTWKSVGGYRGEYCGYTGPAVAKEDGTPTSDMNEDRCGGKLSDCRLRKWPDEVLNFGGFPAAGLMRT